MLQISTMVVWTVGRSFSRRQASDSTWKTGVHALYSFRTALAGFIGKSLCEVSKQNYK